jgi:hypothetical protein
LDYIDDIIEDVCQNLNVKYNSSSINWISRPDFKGQVADAALIFKINGIKHDDDAVFIISNPDYPNFVEDAVKKAEKISTLVPPNTSKSILLPSFSGYYGEQSFSAFPMLDNISQNRLCRAGQKYLLKNGVNEWIGELTKSSHRYLTGSDEINDIFIKPLLYVIGETQFSAALRNAAERTVAAINTKEFIPSCCIQHGDLWLGNILLNRDRSIFNRRSYGFSVIDWGSANINGYPFIDQLRFSMSSTKSRAAYSRTLLNYASFCDISPELFLNYVCTSIGRLGLNRNEFPFDRYLIASEKLFSTASNLIDKK